MEHRRFLSWEMTAGSASGNHLNTEAPHTMWRDLSPELIFEILQYFLPVKLSAFQLALFPWYLGHICKSWRAAFISFPQFWNVLIVDLDQDGKSPIPLKHVKRALELTKMSLERSGAYPISFRLSMSNPPLCPLYSSKKNMSSIYGHQILEALVAHCARWRDAYLALHVCKLPTLYLGAKNRLPVLRSVKLTLSYKIKDQVVADSPIFQRTYGDLFTNAPQLTHTSFNNSSLWKTDWASMTVLHLSKPPLPHELPRFSEASRLETLVITDPPDVGSGASSYRTTLVTLLPSLKFLRTPMLDTLFLFKTPKLEELCTRNDLRPMAVSLEITVSGYFSSLANLRKLSIFVVGTVDAQWIFWHMPAVEDVSIYTESVDVLQLLSIAPRARQLQRLTFGLTSVCEYTRGNLMSMIQRWDRRAKGIGPFENLRHFALELPLDERRGRSRRRLPIPKLFVTNMEDYFRSQNGVNWTIGLHDWKNQCVMDIPPFELFS